MEDVTNSNETSGKRRSVWSGIAAAIGARWYLYLGDFIAMKLGLGVRHHQLAAKHLVCRFCDYPIGLMGSWECQCGFKRPGNYYGRCPACLSHPHFIDCPSCGFTMDVR